MQEISIDDTISYISATEDPLSADIGIIREAGQVWLFDVGNGEETLPIWREPCNVVLSHFHKDHIGSLDRVSCRELFVSAETRRHVHRGNLVTNDIFMDGLHIFPLPSSHAEGCLGLEVRETYAFVGDALYSRSKNGDCFYSANLLQEEIAVLKKLRAPFLFVSHRKEPICRKEDILDELKRILALRQKGIDMIRINPEEM